MWHPKLYSLVAAAALAVGGQGFAQTAPGRPAPNPQANPAQRPAAPQDRQEAITLPEFLTQLNLSSQQEQQIREVIRTHNQKAEQIWEQFHQLHWQTVEAEASMAAANALEGHDHAAHHQGEAAARPQAQENRANPRPIDNQARPAQRPPQREVQAPRNERTAQQAEAQNPAAEEPQIHIVGMRVAVLQPNGMVREVQLEGNAPEQKVECEICAAHAKHLKELWSQLHEAHRQLVKNETDRMIAIESKLTEEQLKQLQQKLQENMPVREAQGQNRGQSEAAERQPRDTRKE